MIAAGTYFFPGNLPYYVAKVNLAGVSEVCFALTIIRGVEGVVLRPVFDVDLELLKSGTWGYFCEGLAADTRGFFTTEWEPVNEDASFIGEVYVAVVVEVASDIDEEDLAIGLAEIDAR